MVFEEVYNNIRKKYPKKENEILFIGIQGNIGSGKSHFTKQFAEFLKKKNVQTIHWVHDFYLEPRAQKHAKIKELEKKGMNKRKDWWKIFGKIDYNAYNRNLLEEHFIKFRNKQDIEPIKLYNSKTGELDKEVNYTFKDSTKSFWLLHDGVYLFDKKIRKHLDYMIVITTGKEKLVNGVDIGEKSEEREIRFKRTYDRGLKRGYQINFQENFLPLDIFIAEHNRKGMLSQRDNLTIINNEDYSNRKIISKDEILDFSN